MRGLRVADHDGVSIGDPGVGQDNGVLQHLTWRRCGLVHGLFRFSHIAGIDGEANGRARRVRVFAFYLELGTILQRLDAIVRRRWVPVRIR